MKSLSFTIWAQWIFIQLFLLFISEQQCYTHQEPSSTSTSGLDSHQHQVAAAIDNILNADKIVFNHEEAGKLVPVDETAKTVSGEEGMQTAASEQLGKYIQLETVNPAVEGKEGANTPSADSANDTNDGPNDTNDSDDDKPFASLISSSSGADISVMNSTFNEIFTRPRSDDYNRQMKESARNAILSKMKEYGLEAFTQSFTANRRGGGGPQKGINLIGIAPGRSRGTGQDKILLVGAHYDTVQNSAGIDDNASGMIVLLEIARILSNQPQLNHTVMFVGFDLEELGLLGSIAFVREYFIPTELVGRKATFLGAYVIDMALNYDPNPGSQTLPRDIMIACPGVTSKIAQDGNRGDFIAVWMRKGVDGHIYKKLVEEWGSSSKYKLRVFDPILPGGEPSPSDLYRYGTFTRSDHASFWYHKHPNFKNTLNAILLTDMGVWRGERGSKCYHNWCDDTSFLTERNLKFLKNTIDSLSRVVMNPPNLDDEKENAGTGQSTNTGVESNPPFGQRIPSKPTNKPSSVKPEGRGVRTNRGRGPPQSAPRWPSIPPPTVGAFPGSQFFPSAGSIPPLGSIPSMFSF